MSLGRGSIPGTKASLPQAWKLVRRSEEHLDDKVHAWMPYEFTYKPRPQGASAIAVDDPKYTAFLDEYTAAICHAGLEEVVGLSVMPAPEVRSGLRFTEGTSNVLLRSGQVRISLSICCKISQVV